jgi:phospholipase/carboxylesterase/glyoxalase family protein
MTASSFIHRFVAAERPDAPTLLLLHGTGGDEDDLLPLGRALLPGAALLSPRGKVLERGMPRFFSRLAEGVFDLEDLQLRTHELADWIDAAAAEHRFDPARVIAVGYSNGANIAASLLLLRPGTLAGAVLFHSMLPLEPHEQPNLPGVPVFLTGGRADQMIDPAGTERLAELLRAAGADVTLHWEPGGHTLTGAEVEAARRWLAGHFAVTGA